MKDFDLEDFDEGTWFLVDDAAELEDDDGGSRVTINTVTEVIEVETWPNTDDLLADRDRDGCCRADQSEGPPPLEIHRVGMRSPFKSDSVPNEYPADLSPDYDGSTNSQRRIQMRPVRFTGIPKFADTPPPYNPYHCSLQGCDKPRTINLKAAYGGACCDQHAHKVKQDRRRDEVVEATTPHVDTC